MLQLRVAEPLASLAVDAVNVRVASPAAAVGVVLSPGGNETATAATVTTVEFALVPSFTEVAVMVALQFALSTDSAGGVYVAVIPEAVSVPQTGEVGFEERVHVTPAFELSLVTVAVMVVGVPPATMVAALEDTDTPTAGLAAEPLPQAPMNMLMVRAKADRQIPVYLFIASAPFWTSVRIPTQELQWQLWDVNYNVVLFVEQELWIVISQFGREVNQIVGERRSLR